MFDRRRLCEQTKCEVSVPRVGIRGHLCISSSCEQLSDIDFCVQQQPDTFIDKPEPGNLGQSSKPRSAWTPKCVGIHAEEEREGEKLIDRCALTQWKSERCQLQAEQVGINRTGMGAPTHSRPRRAFLPWSRRCREVKTGQRHICAAICANLTPQRAFGLTCTLKGRLFPPETLQPPSSARTRPARTCRGGRSGLTLRNPDHPPCTAVWAQSIKTALQRLHPRAQIGTGGK